MWLAYVWEPTRSLRTTNAGEAGDAMREAARREGLWAEADPDGYRMYKARQS